MIFYDTIEEARNAEVYTHILTTPEDWKAKTTKGKFIACVKTPNGFIDAVDHDTEFRNLSKWVPVEVSEHQTEWGTSGLRKAFPDLFKGGPSARRNRKTVGLPVTTHRPLRTSDYVPLLVDRLDIGESTAWLWLKDDADEVYQRRVQAAITSERTDWTPIADVAGHLESQFGVTVKQVAEWYGYNPHSIYGIIGNGRFVDKRPKRALTLIDYYLKENELC